jgi:hypothetical protein
MFSPLHAYFLTTHGNGEVPILGKLPYFRNWHLKVQDPKPWPFTYYTYLQKQDGNEEACMRSPLQKDVLT